MSKYKNYNLNQLPNEGVKDNAPSWMNDFFNTKIEKKENPFKDKPFDLYACDYKDKE